MKPNLFIGSSSEKLMYAYALQEQLKSSANVTLWNQGFFQLNASYLESLIAGLKDSDFGVFVFAPDDILSLRGDALASIRDNVIFELGLAMGQLGRDRVFFILPEAQGGLRLPSDLLGLSTVKFDGTRDNLEAAVGPACFKILQAVAKLGVRQDRLAPPTVEIVQTPRVLCACSPQYFQRSFEKDIELIRRETEKISAAVTEVHAATAGRLTDLLMEHPFDLIHICAYVDPKTGEVYFNDMNPDGTVPAGATKDSIEASAFAQLVKLAKAKLVVLATCDSLVLAAKLARVTNMIAATGVIRVDEILKWELGLYRCLSRGSSLSNAYETASAFGKADMMLLLLKKDLAFIG